MSRYAEAESSYNVILCCDKCLHKETYHVRANTPDSALARINDIEKEWNGWTFRRRKGKVVADLCPNCSNLHRCPQCHKWVKKITSRGNCIACAGASL